MITLRKIETKDMSILFDWANEIITRRNSIAQDIIEWKDHCEWFQKKIMQTDSYVFILEVDNQESGQIRFDKVDGKYLIDFSISKEKRGLGLGKAIVSLGMAEVKKVDAEPTFEAFVKETNIASRKIFETLGFKFVNEKPTMNLINYITK